MGDSESRTCKSCQGCPNPRKRDDGPPKFAPIRDSFESIEQVQRALEEAGLESSNLILGIDYTISNTGAGKKTFGGKSLHSIDISYLNPYQHAIGVLGRTLAKFDDDNLIPVYGFGDKTTSDKTVFPFFPDSRPANGIEEVLSRYIEITPHVTLGGPTSFAPIIREAIKIVKQEKSYHILVIIADGQVTPDSEWCDPYSQTVAAIVEASNYPISILTIGVGDGPWEKMVEFDDELPERKFDNFQFVEFAKEIKGLDLLHQDTNFAIAALQEIPEQYWHIRKLGLLQGH